MKINPWCQNLLNKFTYFLASAESKFQNNFFSEKLLKFFSFLHIWWVKKGSQLNFTYSWINIWKNNTKISKFHASQNQKCKILTFFFDHPLHKDDTKDGVTKLYLCIQTVPYESLLPYQKENGTVARLYTNC